MQAGHGEPELGRGSGSGKERRDEGDSGNLSTEPTEAHRQCGKLCISILSLFKITNP